MESTSDERTTNNVMRHEYRVLTEDEKQRMKAIKDLGKTFYDYIEATLPRTRETSLAKTRIEEAVMWGVKEITR